MTVDARKVGKFVRLNFWSRLAGHVAEIRVPQKLLRPGIWLYSKLLGVNLDEVDFPSEGFSSFAEFFVRRLKPECRPIDSTQDRIVSPADGTLQSFGKIEHGQLIQIKGSSYSLADLLGSETEAAELEGGWHATVYLSPADYHRVHSPIDGHIVSWRYVPGSLFPVNSPAIRIFSSLYPANERMIIWLSSDFGPICIAMVGASLVGRIDMKHIEKNTNARVRIAQEGKFNPPVRIKKGEELGAFRLGSTVVLMAAGHWTPMALQFGMKVRMGVAIAQKRKS